MIFTELFYKNIILRKSCGKCHYCNLMRPSDITIADFWGWEKTDPEFNKDDKGVSLVLINTEKGRKIFNEVQDRMYIFHADIEDVLQPNLQRPTSVHPDRIQFEKEYVDKGFLYVKKRWTYRLPLKDRILIKLKGVIKKVVCR